MRSTRRNHSMIPSVAKIGISPPQRGDLLYNAAMKMILVSVYLLLAIGAFAQDKAIKKVAPRPTVAIDGKTLFNQYCAVCHGHDGKGGGPAADALKMPPTDLTQMSRENGGKFPEQHVLGSLKGTGVKAHGSEDMPIWGPIFNNMNASLGQGQTRTYALMMYLETLQAK